MQTTLGESLLGLGYAEQGDRPVRQGPRHLHGQARPRPPRHAHQHEQPGGGLPGRREARPGPAALRGDAQALTKAKLGPDHPDTLTSMNNLAAGYQAAGKLDLALPLFEETLEAQEGQARPRPPRHPHQHEQPGRGLPGRRQAGPGPAALRGDAEAAEGQARPRPPRHAHQHEQPGGGLPGRRASWTWPCRSSRRR